MPVIKSAIKKLRHDKKIEKGNDLVRAALEKAVKVAKKSQNKKDISLAFSLIDKAAKKHVIHKNKAARIKASLSNADATKKSAKTQEAPSTKATKKVAIKVTKAEKTASKK